MTTIFRTRLAILAAAALTLIGMPTLSVCAETSGDMLKLKLGYNIGSLNREVFLETAFRQGYFKKHGLEIEDKGYSVGGQIIQDLVGGNLDIGLAGISPSLTGIARGGDIIIVSSQVKNTAPLIVRNNIKSFKDLDGRKIGTPGVSSIQETMLIYLEKQNGFKTKHVYGKATELVNYMEKGEIDGILAWEPVASQAVAKLDAHYLLNTAIEGAEASMVTVSGKLLREHPEVVVNFLKATEETRQYISTHLDEVIQIASEKTGIPFDVIKNGVTRSKLFMLPLTINMESVRLIAEIDIASGKLPGVKAADLDQFLRKAIDESFLKKSMN
ncbi:MAG TPA: ABC transporter substrate-binding protein [Bellilinea sp.]|mgnify:CR=1 FL=1|nr:ABC transporter substrate-binding protein [Bellilinea sp.]